VGDPSEDDGSEGPVIDTLSVLFTDLVASTQMRQHLGDDAAEQLRRQHDQVIVEVAGAHGGHVVKHLGDGLLVTFRSAARAVAAAVSMQQELDRQAHHHSDEPMPHWLRKGDDQVQTDRGLPVPRTTPRGA
jgi:class 3 adenylate cyclase